MGIEFLGDDFWKIVLHFKYVDLSRPEIRKQQKYFSQYGQDRFLNDRVFKDKRYGTFLDIGAWNGVAPSNTLFFEKDLEWQGICLEPLAFFEASLKEQRRTSVFLGGLSIRPQKRRYFVVEGASASLSDFGENWTSQKAERVRREMALVREIELECLGIHDLMALAHLKSVDYLSLDSRAVDPMALENLDFLALGCRAVSFENRNGDGRLPKRLEQQGFEVLGRLGISEIYALPQEAASFPLDPVTQL